MRIQKRRANSRAILPRRSFGIAVFAAALSLASAAHAQSPVTPPAVTRLGDLYSVLQRDNPRISAARALVRAADARVSGAKRPPDPQLQLGFMNYTLPGLTPMAPLGMTQLQLMQMVPLGGKLALAGRIAGAQAAATGERANEVVWEVRSQVAMAFYDLYASDRQLVVERETVRLLQDIARTAESMYRVGQGRQADVLRAQVEIARMTEDTLRMTAMRQTMVARLNALLDRDAATSVALAALPLFPDVLPGRSWLDSLGAIDRPMIKAGVEGVRAAAASATLARRELIPDIQVGIQYGQQKVTMTGIDTEGMTSTERKTERMGSLMIGASIPIFARDRQLQMRNEMNAMKTMAEADLAAMRADTRGKIGEAYAALTRARTLQRLYRTTVLPQAEATVASALSAYRVGTVDFMTLLDDRMTVNKYREELSTLEADEGKAWADLEMLTGRELLNASAIANGTSPFTIRNTSAAQATRGVR